MSKSKRSRTSIKHKHRQVVIETKGIGKSYNIGKTSELEVLKGIDLKIYKGEFVAIMGPSGSGKTTLLDIIGCLLRPTIGILKIEGKETEILGDSDLAHIRGEKIGFVFQQYNLIPSSTALENVELPLRIMGNSKDKSKKRALHLLTMVGLKDRVTHRPSELSGGEQQRVAIARCLANNPSIILADEPTGNLDTKTGNMIMDILRKLNKKGYTLIIISHDSRIGKQTNRLIKLRDGEII